jgi:hypothetical protein
MHIINTANVKLLKLYIYTPLEMQAQNAYNLNSFFASSLTTLFSMNISPEKIEILCMQ